MSMSLIAAKKILEEHKNFSTSSSVLDAIDVAIDAIDAQFAIKCNLDSLSKSINFAQTKISDDLACFLVQVRDFSTELDFAQCIIDSELSRFSNFITKEVDD